MVQISILSGKQAGNHTIVRRFPFSIGRSPGNHLQLEDSGVWDSHLVLEWVDRVNYAVRTEGEALLSINQQSQKRAVLRQGDILAVGSVKLQFWLAPPAQRGLTLREAVVWSLLVAVTATQLALIYWLGYQ